MDNLPESVFTVIYQLGGLPFLDILGFTCKKQLLIAQAEFTKAPWIRMALQEERLLVLKWTAKFENDYRLLSIFFSEKRSIADAGDSASLRVQEANLLKDHVETERRIHRVGLGKRGLKRRFEK